MSATFLEAIILYCLRNLNGERTIYSILHLLNGKKSSQTIQDAHLFSIGLFFKTFQDLTRQELEKIIAKLENEGYVYQTDEQQYKLTNSGLNICDELLTMYPVPKYLNGWKHHRHTSLFWERLSLLVQVASNLNHHQSKYIPIQKSKDVQIWLKRFIAHLGFERHKLGEKLFQELESSLEHIGGDMDPSVFVIRLTGYSSIGLTEEQASETLNVEGTLYHVQFLSILHYLLDQIESKGHGIPLLQKIISDRQEGVPITESTKRTYQLLVKGYTKDEIARMRKLKTSTIEDHIVEITLHNEKFDITTYVDEKKQMEILAAAQRSTSKQLKHIRQNITEADYFQIRLVIAKHGDKTWN